MEGLKKVGLGGLDRAERQGLTSRRFGAGGRIPKEGLAFGGNDFLWLARCTRLLLLRGTVAKKSELVAEFAASANVVVHKAANASLRSQSKGFCPFLAHVCWAKAHPVSLRTGVALKQGVR